MDACWSAGLIALLALSATVVIVWDRHHHSPKKGIGVRVIQLLAVVLLIPSLVVLSLAGSLNGEATASLLGAVVGYVLSGIGEGDSNS